MVARRISRQGQARRAAFAAGSERQGLRHLARRPGFSMLEVMAVMVILGALAAVAIPSLVRSIRRSRVSEAVMNVERMWIGAVAYYNSERGTETGGIIGHQFPSSSPATPEAMPSAHYYEPTDGNWQHETWHAINFAMSSPHLFQYLFFNMVDCDPPGGGGAAFAAGSPFGSPGGPVEGATGMWAPDGSVICQPHKWTVCHSGRTIAVANPAILQAHLDHGDPMGICAGDDRKLFPGGFYAVASGNLDGDDQYSAFYRSGFVTRTGDIRGMPVIYEESPFE